MNKIKDKKILSCLALIIAACMLFAFGACNSVKSIYFVPGEWSAENVQVGEIEIGKITLTITETYEEGEDYIVSNGNEYGYHINISGEETEAYSATWISKYERLIGFMWRDNYFNLFIETKQDSDSIYIDVDMTMYEDVFESIIVIGSVSFTMY